MADSKERGSESSEFMPEIRRGRVERLTIYEVSEAELETLARGSANSVYLNFAIFLFSVFVSFLIALLTTSITSERMFNAFFVIVVIGAIGGMFSFILWLKMRKSISDVVQTIKRRLPAEGIQETRAATDD